MHKIKKKWINEIKEIYIDEEAKNLNVDLDVCINGPPILRTLMIVHDIYQNKLFQSISLTFQNIHEGISSAQIMTIFIKSFWTNCYKFVATKFSPCT